MADLERLTKLAAENNLTIKDCGGGHVQIVGGALLVNYWPDSKKKTAYVAGTVGGQKYATPQEALRMALEAPSVKSTATARKSNSRGAKMRLLRNRNTCQWCGCLLSLKVGPGSKKATLEHIIPLKRGGLDNANNRTLACEECNNGRGHNMPEVKLGAKRPE